MRTRDFLMILAVTLLFAGCISTIHGEKSGAWVGEIISYNKAVSSTHGVVGYVKEYRYVQEAYGEPFTLYHVYDLDFVERGVIDELGKGTKYNVFPPGLAEARGKLREEISLEAQPLPYNVGVILGVTPLGIKLKPATADDLKK